MRKGIATPEKNLRPSLTIPVKTRSPLEAFNLLRQGQPIDKMGAYYDDKGLLEKDFWMMDKVAKLHHLSEIKSLEADLQRNAEMIQSEIKQQQINEQQAKEVSSGQATESSPQPGGTI